MRDEIKNKKQPKKVSEKDSELKTENSEAVNNGSLLSVREVSKMTGYHRDYVTSLARSGKLKASKIGSAWVFDKSDVEQLMKSNLDPEAPVAVQQKEVQDAKPEITEQEKAELHSKLQQLKSEVIAHKAIAPVAEHLVQIHTDLKSILNSQVDFKNDKNDDEFHVPQIREAAKSVDLKKYFAATAALGVVVALGLVGYSLFQKQDAVKTSRPQVVVVDVKPGEKIGDDNSSIGVVQGPSKPVTVPEDNSQPTDTGSAPTKIVYIQGPAGARGPQGPQGPTGQTGAQGPQGQTGSTVGVPAVIFTPQPPAGYIPSPSSPTIPPTTIFAATDISTARFNADTATIGNLSVTGTVTGAFNLNGPLQVLTTTTPQAEIGYDVNNEWTVSTSSTGITTFAFKGVNSSAVFKPENDQVNAFNFTNAAGTSVFNVDTQNGRIGINKVTPTAALDVNGNTILTGDLTVTGTTTLASDPGKTVAIGNTTGSAQLTGSSITLNANAADLTLQTATSGNLILVPSGSINLNSDVVLAAGKNITVAAGASNFDFSASTGTFSTGSGDATFNNVNTNLAAVDPKIDAADTSSTLFINTVNNRPVTFGNGNVTIPNLYVTNYQQNAGTFLISSSTPTGSIFTVTDPAITDGTLITQNLTANAGNGQVSNGQIINLVDSTTAAGGYSAFAINVTGSGVGSGTKTLLDLNPGANKEIVFDSTGALRPTSSVATNTNSVGSPSFYWKNGYFDTLTANNLAGTVVTGSTSSTTWTIGSTEVGDSNEAIIFQRNSGSGNATLQWNAGVGDSRYLSVNYPFNSTYTVNDSSIGTGVNLYSGMLTNNTTGGTQTLLSLTNTGTGTTEKGIVVNNTGTGTTAFEIQGTWTNGIVTNNNSISAGTGTITAGTVTAPNVNLTVINSAGDMVGIGVSQKLSQLTVKQQADSTLAGTTTANTSTTITGSGTSFLSTVGIGDRISLSSASGTYATVTAIASGTSLTVDTALGNGASQTINLKKSLLRADDNTGAVKLLVKDSGNVAIGTALGLSKLSVALDGTDAVSNGIQLQVPESTISSARIGLTTDGGTGRQQAYIKFMKLNAGSGRQGAIAFFTAAVNDDNGSEAMRIDNSGNVGIGTTTPDSYLGVASKLAVNGALNVGTSANIGTIMLGGTNVFTATNSPLSLSINSGGFTNVLIPQGKVGINRTTPAMRLDIAGTNGFPANSGTAPTGALRLNAIGGTSVGAVLDFGTDNSSGSSWLQATDSSNLATNYALLLNPNGGNVGIGVTNPSFKLDVVGTVHSTGAATFDSTITSGLINGQTISSAANFTGTVAVGGPLTLSGGASGCSTLALVISVSDCGTGFYRSANHVLTFQTGGSDRVSITDTGLGVGTTNPQSKLDVSGAVAIGTYAGSAISAANGLAVSGNVGIGTTNPSGRLAISGTLTSTTTSGVLINTTSTDGANYTFGIQSNHTVTPASSSSAYVNGANLKATVAGANTGTLHFLGVSGGVDYDGTGGVAEIYGASFAIQGSNNARVGGTIANAYGVATNITSGTTTYTATNAHLFYAGAPGTANVSGTNIYGLYVADLSTSSFTNKYGVYVNGTTPSYFGGNVGLGVTNPAQKLEVNGSLRVSSGSNQIEKINSSTNFGLIYPKNAFCAGCGSTGAIKVVLPSGIDGTGDAIVKIWVDVYEYGQNQSFTAVISGRIASGQWINTSSMIIGTSTRYLPVRFGRSGTSTFEFWIGETDTAWNGNALLTAWIPQVEISRGDITKWQNNWNVSMVTSFDTVDLINTETQVASTSTTRSLTAYEHLADYSTGSADTGTLKLTIPVQSTPVRMVITGYDYSSNGAWSVDVGGLLSGTSWVNTSAYVSGTPPFKKVRLAHDGTNGVLLLGDTSTSWNREQVELTRVLAPSGNNNSSWTMSMIASEAGIVNITNIALPTFVLNSGNVGIGTTNPAAKLNVTATGTYGAAGVSGLLLDPHTVTLSGANPTTYATFFANQVGAMTLVGSSAGQTVTDAAAVNITSAPIKSTNVALTNTYALLISAGAVSTATNSYGLTVNAQTGASNNYAAAFLGGNVGIGVTNPFSKLSNTSATITDGTIGSGSSSVTWYQSTADTYAMAIQNDSSFGEGLLIKAGNDKGQQRTLLHVLNGDNTSRFIVNGNGNVGIGVTNPYSLLSNKATQITDGSATGLGSTFNWSSPALGSGDGYAAAIENLANSGWGLLVKGGGDKTSTRRLLHVTNNDNTSRFIVLADGSVGIGNSAPGSLLEIGTRQTQGSVLPTFQEMINSNTASGNTLVLSNAGAVSRTSSVQFRGSTTADASAYSAGQLISGFTGTGFSSSYLTLGSASNHNTFNNELTLTNGSVGIGKTNPSVALDVVGAENVSGLTTLSGKLVVGAVGSVAADDSINVATGGIKLFGASPSVYGVGTGDLTISHSNNINFSTGGGNKVIIDTAGTLKAATDNAYDIGASGANRFRDLFLSRNATISGTITSPGTGASSEHFGASSIAAGSSSIAIGNNAQALSTGFGSGANSIAIGASAISRNSLSIIIGNSASEAVQTIAGGNVVIGASAASTSTGDGGNVVIGRNATSSSYAGTVIGAASQAATGGTAIGNNVQANFNGSIAIGINSRTTAANQFVAGNIGDTVQGPVSDVYFGTGVVSTTPQAFTLHGTSGSGANIAGANVVIAGGQGTGTGVGGDIILQTAAAGSTGSSLNGLSERVRITTGGNLGVGITNPSQKLVVVGTALVGSGTHLLLGDDGNGGLISGLGNGSPNNLTIIGSTTYVTLGSGVNIGSSAVFPSNAGGLTTTGNVGIGLTNPVQKLEVAGSILLQSNNNLYFKNLAGAGASGWSINPVVAGNFQIKEESLAITPFVINTSGQVGIGLTNPSFRLDVNGTTNIADQTFVTRVASAQTDGTIKLRAGSAAGDDVASVALFTRASGAVAASRNWLVGSNLAASGNLDFYASTSSSGNPTSAIMSLLANGSVGIGTPTPSSAAGWSRFLQVSGTNSALSLKNTSTNGADFSIGSDVIGTTGTLSIYGNASNLFNIQSTGNVGIGTTTPNYKLQIHNAAAGSGLQFTDSDSGTTSADGIFIGMSGGAVNNGQFANLENAGLEFYTNGTANVDMFLDSSGNLGIGLTNPGAKLDVNGSIRALGVGIATTGLELSDESGYKKIQSFDSEPLSLNPQGNNVGIGITNPGTTLDIQGAFADFRLKGTNTTSPHIGSSFVITSNQDGVGRTIIGTAGQSRAMYFENNGDIMIPSTKLSIGVGSPTSPLQINSLGAPMPSTATYVATWSTQPGSTCAGCTYMAGRFESSGTAGGNSSSNYGVYASATNAVGANIGLYAITNSTAGNNYGVYIDGPSAAAGNYSLYSASASQSYFAGSIGIGVTAPQTLLDVQGSAPTSRVVGLSGTDAKLTLSSSGVSAWSVRTKGSDASFRFDQDGTDRVTILSGGNFGIGTTNPSATLEVNGPNNGAAVKIGNTCCVGNQLMVQFTRNGVNLSGNILANGAGSTTYSAFTGAHLGLVDDGSTPEPGFVMVMDGNNRDFRDVPGQETIYGVTLNTKANDPAVLGAYNTILDSSKPQSSSNTHYIDAVGNSDVWVVDYGENLKQGDYLITSDVPGYAMKDDGTFQTAHVFAKVSSNVDWSQVSDTITRNGQTFKRKKVSALFTYFDKVNTTGLQLVTDENGIVKEGDYLVASASVPGYLMKAVSSGTVTAKAIADVDVSKDTIQVVNGLTIHTNRVKAEIGGGYQNINNVLVLGQDPTVAQSVNQSTTQTGVLGSVNSALTYVIRQSPKAGDPLADILQVQSGNVTRLMVAASGATTINASVSGSANLFVIQNNGSEQFAIRANGDVYAARLVVKKDIVALGQVIGSSSILARNDDASGDIHQGDLVMLKGVDDLVLGSNPIVSVTKATGDVSNPDGIIVGIADRNLSDYAIPGAPASSGTDMKVIAHGEYMNVITAGTFATLNVDASSGAIVAGDKLTLSNNPGYARKATSNDVGMPVIGVALDGVASGLGKVRVYIALKNFAATAVSSAPQNSPAPDTSIPTDSTTPDSSVTPEDTTPDISTTTPDTTTPDMTVTDPPTQDSLVVSG